MKAKAELTELEQRLLAAKPFAVRLDKRQSYTDTLKAMNNFIAGEDENRVPLQYVCMRNGKLYASDGCALIEADLENWPKMEIVENAMYKLEVVKDTASFTPYPYNAETEDFPTFPRAEAMMAQKPEAECYKFYSCTGDTKANLSKKETCNWLGSLAYDLAKLDYKANLHYLAGLPLNKDYTVSGVKCANSDRGGMSPIHFVAKDVHCIIMPIRK